jgi:hypothetical protein
MRKLNDITPKSQWWLWFCEVKQIARFILRLGCLFVYRIDWVSARSSMIWEACSARRASSWSDLISRFKLDTFSLVFNRGSIALCMLQPDSTDNYCRSMTSVIIVIIISAGLLRKSSKTLAGCLLSTFRRAHGASWRENGNGGGEGGGGRGACEMMVSIEHGLLSW